MINVEYKIQKLIEEFEDLIQGAQEAFNNYNSNDVPEEDAKKTMQYLFKNGIHPSNAGPTLANMASGIGKTASGDEIENLYNKAEQGKNTIANSHAIQNYFENHRTSSNETVDNLLHGVGKNLDDAEAKKLMSGRGLDDVYSPEDINIARRAQANEYQKQFDKQDATGQPEDFFQLIHYTDDKYSSEHPKNSPGDIDQELWREHLTEKYGEDPIQGYVDEYKLDDFKAREAEFKDLRRLKDDVAFNSKMDFYSDELKSKFAELYPEKADRFEELSHQRDAYRGYQSYMFKKRLDDTKEQWDTLSNEIKNQLRDVPEAGGVKTTSGMNWLQRNRPDLYDQYNTLYNARYQQK